LQLPELTTTERDAVVSPNDGMKIYNTTLGEEQTYNGSSWSSASDNSFFDLSDVDDTGIADGDLFEYNSISGNMEVVSTVTFDSWQNTNEANLIANGQLSTIISAGYKIDTIIIKETSGNAAGNISLGTVASGTQIVNAATVGANAVVDATLVDDFFSDTADTNIYISSSAWGSGIIQVYFTFKKVI